MLLAPIGAATYVGDLCCHQHKSQEIVFGGEVICQSSASAPGCACDVQCQSQALLGFKCQKYFTSQHNMNQFEYVQGLTSLPCGIPAAMSVSILTAAFE